MKRAIYAIKMHFREMEYEDRDWIQLVQGRVQWQSSVNTIINHWVS
jgi:hypothetical protein